MHYWRGVARRILLIGAGLTACIVAIAQDQDVLPPEEAFPYTIEASGDELVLSFDVQDGYYLYRERFDFSSQTEEVELGTPQLPDGKIYEDEFFGVVETYRGEFDVTIPYGRATAVSEMDFQLIAQGCADIGLCYPPQRWITNVSLPEGDGGGDSFLSTLLSNNSDEILPPDEAFVMDSRVDGSNEVTLSWFIEPGYYLYRDKFAFSTDSAIQLGSARIPQGAPHFDEHFGDVEVFYDYVEVQIPFSRASPDAIDIIIDAEFQGCKVDSICYPVIADSAELELPPSSAFAGQIDDTPLLVSEQDRLAALVLSDSWWLVLGTFYGLGLLLAFTPCVLPMVPILSGIIAGQGDNVTAGRGFALSLSYVMGMALTYTIGGAVAASFGAQLQAAFQEPWLLTLFAALFVGLALSMFGMFELQMPSAIQTRLANMSNSQKSGTFVGTAIMGALSALIVTTCVAPPLVATLAVIGQSGDVVRGAGALFALSMGMGSPLLLVGASAGKLLPKAGAWMNMVKAGFGVMMLGLAVWMMGRVLPGSITLLLWALLVFLTGVFLGAFEPLPQAATPTRRLGKGFGVMACIYGALMLIGVTLGGDDPLEPIPRGSLLAGSTQALDTGHLAFEPIESVAELEVALADARAAGTPVMFDFSAEWCVACKEMEKYTFPEPAVIAALEPFVLLQADVTENDDDDKALLQYFGSFGPPTIAFYDAAGQEQPAYKLVGYVPAEEFATHIRRLAAL
jgi:thiol:disulfide interchange protein DsbD